MYEEAKKIYNNPILRILNNVLLPIKLIVPQPVLQKFKFLTTNQEIRFWHVLSGCYGVILDIGCGDNILVNEYRKLGKKGIGIDVYNWSGADVLIDSCHHLPFDDECFDVVTFVASINHIPERRDALKEAHRVLKKNGKIIITYLNPLLSRIWHRYAIWDEDIEKRGYMRQGEVYGFTKKQIQQLIFEAGFSDIRFKKFSLGLNNIVDAKKMAH